MIEKMNLDSLQTACLLLKSPKAGDRKRGAENLLELISENEEVCRSLDYNSMHKDRDRDKLTWTGLFNEVRDYFAKETERLSSGQGSTANKNFCFSVVGRVVQKGTCHRPWITWSRVFEFITGYLSQEMYASVFGSAFVSMLQNFLSIELYVSIIDGNSWIELIKLLLKIFGKYNIPPFMVLQCLNLAIQEGSNHPAVIGTLRSDVVRFYESIFSSDRSSTRPHIVLFLRGVTALCRRNSIEFRGILCKLGESIIPSVLHSSNYVSEEESAIIELLLVQLQLHCPCDINMKNAAFYAADPRKWLEILRNIYAFCLDTLEDIAIKKQSHFKKELHASDKLVILAAKCTKQIYDGQFEEHSSSGDEDDPNPTKKAMRYRSFNNVLSEVCSRMSPGESQIIWMNYLTAVLTQFPSLVGSRMNYSCLFNMGLNFLNSSFVARREVYVFFLCLLNTEKYLIDSEILKNRSRTWEGVWDITIRSLSLNESKTEAMELLRKLLIEVQPSNLNALLLTYVNGSMPVTLASLNLLAEYLARCSLPLYIGSTMENISTTVACVGLEIAATTCPRLALIRWLVNCCGDDPELGHEPLVGTILASLLVRQTHNLIYAEKFCHRPSTSSRIPSELTHYEVAHEDFEKIILKCCFVQVPGESHSKRQMIKQIKNFEETLQLSLIPSVPGRLVESLQEDYDKLPIFDASSAEFMRKYIQLNYRVSLYLNIVNVLEKHSIGNGEAVGFRTNLEKLFDKALSKCIEIGSDFITKGKDKSAIQVQEVISITRNMLKSGHLCDQVKTLLAQRFPQQMQELLKKVYRSNLARYIERAANNQGDTLMFGSHDLLARLYFCSSSGGVEDAGVSECRQIELAALEGLGCLIDYGLVCDHRVDLFTDILKDCMQEAYNSAIPFIFEFSSELINRLTPTLDPTGGCSDLLSLITNLLQKMCRGFYQIPQCSARLWELFADITSLTANDTDVNKKYLMILVGTLSGFMKTNNAHGSSILVCQAGFRALSEVAKHDPNLSWSVFTPKNGQPSWVLHEVYEFLNNSSHQIRLFAADTICLMYEYAGPPPSMCSLDGLLPDASSTQTAVSVNKREEYYEKIFQFLQKTFSIPTSLSEEENTEEAVNRTSVAISCLTRLIFAYPFIQKKSLFSLLKLVKVKGIDVQLTKRALNCVSTTAAKTMCCHVSFLIQMWLKSNHSIEDFPYQFFGCDSMGNFYRQFKKEISVEFFSRNDTEGLAKFGSFFNLEPLDLIKDCYGMLMARMVPGLAVYKSKNLPSAGSDISHLQEIQKRLNLALGGKSNTEALMMTCLDDVVLQLVSLVFDPLIPSAWGCPDIRLPEPSSAFYDESSLDTSVQFLKEASSKKEISLIAFLATYNPKSIYETLLTLITRVHNSHDILEKFWRLHQFSYFVKQLLQEPLAIFNTMKEYVCQFVVYAYLRLLNSEMGEGTYSKYLRHALVFLISQLVINLTLSYKEEMKHHYYSIVNGLVSSVVKYPDLVEAAKKALDVLLIRYTDDFADCIVALDPFPLQIEHFEEYREIYLQVKYGRRRTDWPLQKELRSCLIEIQSSNGSCTKERLEFLKELLCKKKRELEKIVKSLEGKRFSDECLSDTVHALIQMLVSVIKSGEDEEVVLEACRCLGEIGPVDLSVLVLPSCLNKREIRGMINSVATVLEILADYLKSDDIHLVTTSGDVLRLMCHNTECVDIMNKEFSKTRLESILKPFKTATPSPKNSEKVFANQLETKLGLNEMNEFVDHSTWITQLCCGLIECFKADDSLTALLLPVCKIKVEFCQDVLPFVFFVMLYSGRNNPLVRKTISGYFRNFFSKFVFNQNNLSESSRSFTPVTGGHNQVSIYLNKLALKSMLGVVQFLRNHQAPQEHKGSLRLTPWDNNFWLDINYLDLAKAAQHCGAYLTSILFTEIAATDLEMGGASHTDEAGEDDQMESFYSQGTSLFPRNRGDSFEKLLLKAYTSIGEPDAVYGCGSARFTDGYMNINHLQQRMQFGRVLSACDGNAADSDSSMEAGVCGAMKELGLYNTLWTYLQGIETRQRTLDHELAEAQYECGWRLSKWNLHCDKATYLKDGNFFENSKSHGMLQRFIYEGVQTGLTNDLVNHVESVRCGYRNVSKSLRHASVESSENLYGYLSNIQMLRVVEDFFQTETTDQIGVLDTFLHKWKIHDRINQSDFKFQEPILYLRGILLRAYDQKCPKIDLENAYDDCMLELLAKARESGRLEFSENCAACIGSNTDKILRKDLEIAKNHWARGDQDIARHILGRLLKKTVPDGCDLYPVMLLLYGEWLSETMSERPAVILEKYLSRSCQIYEKRGATSQMEMSKAFFVLAKYADTQYQNVSKYIKSELFGEKLQHLQKAKVDLVAVSNAADADVRRTAGLLKKQCQIDEDEIHATVLEKKKFVLLALRHYLRGLKDSNDQDLLIFRAVALWMENAESSDAEFSREVNVIFQTETMPSYKYIVVLHQLSARLNGNCKGMADILSSILVTCAQQHPYHTLPVLLTQALLHKDQGTSRRKQQQLEERVQAASKLVAALKKDKTLGQLVSKMEQLWIALISLANFQETRSSSTGSFSIPNNALLRTLKGLEIVSVPTTSLPVSPSAEYKDCMFGIQSFESSYSLVGGINSPKRISCIGTNGMKLNMLLKGQDDLRQDAVMQQVFSVMNKLLLAEQKTKTRRLQVRTYKVVPLSQRTGILEWCENTQTFGEYLTGENGAHQKYRPNDYAPLECRRKMQVVKDCGDNDKKHGNFMTVLEHFKPVFRHFFFENFKEAGIFFERRLAYTRSVATNSMVGMILGLGDRHVLNILVDKTTAEFIHIDLGVAFDQGRILPTPETIPFRLTRDVVDGMGVSGVEGVFRKSCEMTLEVLRNNSEVILTILEVLLYDPLYMWTLTPDRMRKVQPAENSRSSMSKRINGNHQETEDIPKERNNSAARVLLRLKQKLVGVEEGGSSGSTLSVPGHVSLLIQQAMDTERLSRLFPGWQPYL